MKEGFFNSVYKVVARIPYGRVTTYGAIAEYLGNKGSARMVGWALNSSKNMSPSLPAHRVVNRNGLLTGKNHFGGNEIMSELLMSEGVKVADSKIINIHDYFWDPSDDR
jgi:methylated-DNA-protein-cysteine methyltransferase-like protein